MAEISVDSIQTGTETITSGDGTTINITITSVDTSRSIVMYTTRNGDNQERNQRHCFTSALTSSTNLQLVRHESSFASSITLEWTVVEFASACVQSLQTGTLAKSAGSEDITVTSVTVDKSFSIVSQKGDQISHNKYARCGTRLTSATTLNTSTADTPGTNDCTVGYQLIEFTSDSGVTVQSGDITVAASGGSATDTITSVDTSKTFLLHGGEYSINSTNNELRSKTEIVLTNATTVTAYRSTTNSYSTTVRYYAVELSGSGQSVETATATISDGNTTPTQPSWTALSTTDTAIMEGNWRGNSHGPDSGGGNYAKPNWASVKLDAGADGATIVRSGTTGDVSVTLFAVDFSSGGGPSTPTGQMALLGAGL